MTRIKMTADFPVAPRGWDTEMWTKDKVEEVDDDLALDLIAANVATETTDPLPGSDDEDAADTPHVRKARAK